MKILLILACVISMAASLAIVKDRRNASTATCIRKTIDKLFSDAHSITFVTDYSEYCDDIVPLELNRPVFVVAVNLHPKTVNFFTTGNDFIFCVRNVDLLSYASYLIGHLKWSERKGYSDVRVLVISPGNVERMHDQCWKSLLYNVVLLSWGSGEEVLSVSNQFTEGNNCGERARVIEKESCAGSVNIQFPKTSNLNQCPLVLAVYHKSRFNYLKLVKSCPDVRYIMEFLMNLMAQYFNTKYVVHVANREGDIAQFIEYNKNISIFLYADPTAPANIASQPVLTHSIVWIVPKSLPVPAIRVVLLAFKSLVWYLIIFTFVSTVFVWWLIVGCQNRRFRLEDGLDAMTNVSSLTILSSIPVMPRSFLHRSVILAYLIYIIHISCAFTSRWIELLTVPQYEFQIKTLQQFADANLPIYISNNFQRNHFSRNDTNNALYEKLQKLLIPCRTHDTMTTGIRRVHNYRNCAAIVTHQDIITTQMSMTDKFDVVKIEDSSITGAHHLKFGYKLNYYFAVHIDTFLQKLVESGIGPKEFNELNAEYFKNGIREEAQDTVVLTLGHLYFAFCLLGLGLALALAVFLVELLTGFIF
uniref:Ionotropic glutamate receptor C-terminal domain-containing protein n=1 Tax=Photinus pyralis TaxID=7054 RepID=A0A1Y1K2K3_PHOPY